MHVKGGQNSFGVPHYSALIIVSFQKIKPPMKIRQPQVGFLYFVAAGYTAYITDAEYTYWNEGLWNTRLL